MSPSRPRLALALCTALLLSGCAMGTAEWALDPAGAPGGKVDGGVATQLGEWRAAMDGLPSGNVTHLAHLDGAVFALVQGAGVFKLPEGAGQWIQASPTLQGGEQLAALAVIDRALYASAADPAGGKGSLHRLKFAEDPWERLAGAPNLPLSAIVKKGGAIVVAASGPSAGIYASTDGAQTWTRRADAVKAPFAQKPIRSFAASSAAQRMFATGEVASGFGGLYASDDEGRTWQRLSLKGDVQAITASGPVVLASLTVDGELRSDNYGNTFHPVDVLGPSRAFFLSGSRGFAGSIGAVLVSEDAGASWREPDAALPTQGEVGLVYLAGNTLIAVAGGSLFMNQLE